MSDFFDEAWDAGFSDPIRQTAKTKVNALQNTDISNPTDLYPSFSNAVQSNNTGNQTSSNAKEENLKNRSTQNRQSADCTESYGEKCRKLEAQNPNAQTHMFNNHLAFRSDMISNICFRGYNLEQLRADQYNCRTAHRSSVLKW